jgi:hypothetical protein
MSHQGTIPGPDPGACPTCGGWRKAGMVHKCGGQSPEVATMERLFRSSDRTVQLSNELNGLLQVSALSAAEARLDAQLRPYMDPSGRPEGD